MMGAETSLPVQAKADLQWRLRRLRSMSVREVLWRIASRMRLARWRLRRRWPSPRIAWQDAKHTYRLPADVDASDCRRVTEAALGILDGQYTALGCTFDIRDVNWARDPQSGLVAPLGFGPLMDFRDSHLVGNVRNIWELNRHQHLMVVALAYALTNDERYARFVRLHLESWLEQNPFPRGVNWASPLELGLRLVSWVWVSRFLTGSPQHEALFGREGSLWPSIFRHQWMISHLHSRGSSANNHLIGEMTGLWVAATAWPVFQESDKWSKLARRILQRESLDQFYLSGVNREQSFGYHIFATELLFLAALEGERAGAPFAESYLDGLRRAADAAAAQMAPGGVVPNYGDDDNGTAFGLLPEPVRSLGWVPAIATEWLGARACEEMLPVDSRLTVRLLLSGVGSRRTEATPTPCPSRTKAFPDAGLFIMTSASAAGELHCLVDAGELGYLALAAHGHADALSFTLSLEGEKLVVDSGTYTYHFDPVAREYFRSTRAHNTVTVDGQSQSAAGGPFLWTRRAQVSLEMWEPRENGAYLKASQDGYNRLPDPVTHRRALCLDGGQLTIDDELLGESDHVVEWRLHLSPHCSARIAPGERLVVRGRHDLELFLDRKLNWSLHAGDSLGGWYSCAFNQREVTTTVVGSARLALPVHLQHVLKVSR